MLLFDIRFVLRLVDCRDLMQIPNAYRLDPNGDHTMSDHTTTLERISTVSPHQALADAHNAAFQTLTNAYAASREAAHRAREAHRQACLTADLAYYQATH